MPSDRPPKIKTSLWVQAQVRQCDVQLIPIAIRHKGDPDSGAILLILLRREDVCVVMRRTTGMEGPPIWVPAGAGTMAHADADGFCDREIGYDRDLWIIEIEDFNERYVLDGPVERV
jgi:hypothetical protein